MRAAIAGLVGIMGSAALLPSSPAGADGTETLGVPSIDIAQGSGIVTDGTGMFTQPAVVNVTVPVNATVKQVLLYWEGYNTSNNLPDNTIRVNGTEVPGQLIGGPTVFFEDVSSTSWRVDITHLGVVGPGPNAVSLSDLAFDYANDGASIAVIYDDNSGPGLIAIRDGNDNAYKHFAAPLNATVPQTFSITAASFQRSAEAHVIVGGVDVNRGSLIRVTSGDVVDTYSNLLGNSDGPQWDDVTVPVTIPAGATSVTIEVISEDLPNRDAASLTWVAAILDGPGAAGNCEPTVPTPATTRGSAYGIDAKVSGGLVKIDKLGYVKSVAPGSPSSQAKKQLSASIAGLVDAKVENTASNSVIGNASISSSTASVANVSLLGGLVKATAVRAASQSFASPFGSSYNSRGATIVGLTVSGAVVNVAPNTKVEVKVPLQGTVAVLYVMEETGTSSFTNGVSSASHSMNALRLVLLKSYLGIPAGSYVVVSQAESAAQSPVSSCPDVESVSGEAFTAYVDGNLGGKDLLEVKVGDAVLPPTGGSDTDGGVVNVPGVATSATAFNTTSGSLEPNPHATSRSIVEGANVLNGVVTARVLDVKATSSADGTTAGTTFATNFVDLRVGGKTIVLNGQVAPNSYFVVGLGDLGWVSVIINEQTVNNNGGTDTAGTVNAVHARLYTLGGLLKGEVIVASAHSDAHV